MDWLPVFLGALVGSLASYGAALLARGTALETDLRQLATDLHEQIRTGSMSVSAATALVEAARPKRRWWKAGRPRRMNRTLDAWLKRFGEAHLLSGNLPVTSEETYDVTDGPKGDEP